MGISEEEKERNARKKKSADTVRTICCWKNERETKDLQRNVENENNTVDPCYGPPPIFLCTLLLTDFVTTNS